MPTGLAVVTPSIPIITMKENSASTRSTQITTIGWNRKCGTCWKNKRLSVYIPEMMKTIDDPDTKKIREERRGEELTSRFSSLPNLARFSWWTTCRTFNIQRREIPWQHRALDVWSGSTAVGHMGGQSSELLKWICDRAVCCWTHERTV